MLLGRRGIELPPGRAELTTATLNRAKRGATREAGRSIDATQALPTEARADVVIVIKDDRGTAIVALIVEIQTTQDTDKHYTWPRYMAALAARLRCRVMLVVIATSPAVARWARRPIESGHPSYALAPIVIGHEDVPGDAAAAMPELAVLAACAHPEVEIVRAALASIRLLPGERRGLHLQPPPLRHVLEGEMTDTEKH